MLIIPNNITPRYNKLNKRYVLWLAVAHMRMTSACSPSLINQSGNLFWMASILHRNSRLLVQKYSANDFLSSGFRQNSERPARPPETRSLIRKSPFSWATVIFFLISSRFAASSGVSLRLVLRIPLDARLPEGVEVEVDVDVEVD